jgi:hypothetical protein
VRGRCGIEEYGHSAKRYQRLHARESRSVSANPKIQIPNPKSKEIPQNPKP